MPGITRAGIDTAGGLILGGGQTKLKLQGYLVAVIGDAVQSHGSGPHGAAIMLTGSSKVFANGIGICRAGDTATCGHAATGSTKAFAG